MDTWFSAIDGLAAFQKTEDPFTTALKKEVKWGYFGTGLHLIIDRLVLILKLRLENGRG